MCHKDLGLILVVDYPIMHHPELHVAQMPCPNPYTDTTIAVWSLGRPSRQ